MSSNLELRYALIHVDISVELIGRKAQFNALSVMSFDWPFGTHVEQTMRIMCIFNANWTNTRAHLRP